MIKTIKDPISQNELQKIAQENFGDMIKGTIDIEKEIIALGGNLHSDSEAELLKNGSKQQNIWGFNIYPKKSRDNWLEYTSLINIRPSVGNRSMEIEDQNIRKKVEDIIKRLVF